MHEDKFRCSWLRNTVEDMLFVRQEGEIRSGADSYSRFELEKRGWEHMVGTRGEGCDK